VSLPLDFHPAVRDEIDSAHDWYEQRRPGLGRDFLDEVQWVLADDHREPRPLWVRGRRYPRRAVAPLSVCGLLPCVAQPNPSTRGLPYIPGSGGMAETRMISTARPGDTYGICTIRRQEKGLF
jgi:hypothetical protein